MKMNLSFRFILLCLSSGSLWVYTTAMDEKTKEITTYIMDSCVEAKFTLLADAILADPEFEHLFPGKRRDLFNANIGSYYKFQLRLATYIEYSVLAPSELHEVATLVDRFLPHFIDSPDFQPENVSEEVYVDEFLRFLRAEDKKTKNLGKLIKKIETDIEFRSNVAVHLVGKIMFAKSNVGISIGEKDAYKKLYKAIDEGKFEKVFAKYKMWDHSVAMKVYEIIGRAEEFFMELGSLD